MEDSGEHMSPQDFLEESSDILKAKMDFLSTQQSVDYTDLAQTSISQIQSQCLTDYQSICGYLAYVPPSQGSKVYGLYGTDDSQQFDVNAGILRRRLFATHQAVTAVITNAITRHVSNAMSLYGPFRNINTVTSLSMSVPRVSVAQELQGSMQALANADVVATPQNSGPLGDGGISASLLRGQVPTANVMPDVLTGHDGRDSLDHGEHPHVQLAQPPAMTDTVFKGLLGFGDVGDRCVYQNMESMSSPCQQAILNHFTQRQAYWEETQALFPSAGSPPGQDHGHGAMFLLMLVALMFGCFLKRQQCKKRKQIMTILRAVQANPSLKSAVEAEAGVQMSDLPPCIFEQFSEAPSSQSTAPRGLEICCTFVKCVLYTILATILGIVVAIVSIVVTMSLIESFSPSDEVGQTIYPSALTANVLLFLVFGALSCVVVFVVRRCCDAPQRTAPSVCKVAARGTFPTDAAGQGGGGYAPSFLPSATRLTFFSNAFGASSAYAPVSQNDSHQAGRHLYAPLMQSPTIPGSEMELVSAPPPVPTHYTMQPSSCSHLSSPPQHHYGQAVFVPVSARPSSSVTMI